MQFDLDSMSLFLTIPAIKTKKIKTRHKQHIFIPNPRSTSLLLFITLQPASQQRVSDDRWGDHSRTDLDSKHGPRFCVLPFPRRRFPNAFSTFIHKTLDPPFTTSRSPNIIIHTPTTRTLDNSKWLAAKERLAERPAERLAVTRLERRRSRILQRLDFSSPAVVSSVS